MILFCLHHKYITIYETQLNNQPACWHQWSYRAWLENNKEINVISRLRDILFEHRLTSKAAIQQWDGSWLLKRRREREMKRARNGVVAERKEPRNGVKDSTRQNINLYVNRTKARRFWGGFNADAARGLLIKAQEVVLSLRSVQIREVEPAESVNAGVSVTVVGWSEVSDPLIFISWKKREALKRHQRKGKVTARDQWAISLFITFIQKTIASYYQSDVEAFSPIGGGRVPLTAEA